MVVTAAGACIVAAAAPVPAVADHSAATSWKPNLRIGPVKFNHSIPANIELLRKDANERFLVRLEGGGLVRGYLSSDPNTGVSGARSIWTTSRALSYRGVRVGMHWRRAKRKLGPSWRLLIADRCRALNTSALREDRTGPVSTQLFFSPTTGRISRIALNEITEFDLLCP